jgi:all-trans-retinol 13,14-reductase
LVNQEVIEVLLEHGRAIGVSAKHPTKDGDAVEYRAPIVISSVGARNTYLKLLPDAVDVPFRDQLRDFPIGPSAVSTYLGLREAPSTIGLHGENHWVFTDLNHDAMRRYSASECAS